MTCRACGAQIADKAIVCYKCGTPTADEAAARHPVRRAARPNWLAAAIFVLVVAVAGWLVPRTAAGSVARIGVWTGLAVAAAGAVLALRRR